MKIIYTYTDEAPALATESLLPIIRAFAAAGIKPVAANWPEVALLRRLHSRQPAQRMQSGFKHRLLSGGAST